LREAGGAEGHVGELFHRIAEALGGGLQKVAVAGRALRVQLEVLHPAVLQDDDLDVLPATSQMTSRRGKWSALLVWATVSTRATSDEVSFSVLGVAGRAHARTSTSPRDSTSGGAAEDLVVSRSVALGNW
jgi:hypothetical protein